MRLLNCFCLLASSLSISCTARSAKHVGKELHERGMGVERRVPSFDQHYNAPEKRDAYLTNKTESKLGILRGN